MTKLRVKRPKKVLKTKAAPPKYKLNRSALQKVSIRVQGAKPAPTAAAMGAGHSSTTVFVQPTGIEPSTSGISDTNTGNKFDQLLAALARIEAGGTRAQSGNMAQLSSEMVERFISHRPRDGRDGAVGVPGPRGDQGPQGPQGPPGSTPPPVPPVPIPTESHSLRAALEVIVRQQSHAATSQTDMLRAVQDAASRVQPTLSTPVLSADVPPPRFTLPVYINAPASGQQTSASPTLGLTAAPDPMDVEQNAQLVLRESTRRAAEDQLTGPARQHRRTDAMVSVPTLQHRRTDAIMAAPSHLELTDGRENLQVVPRAERSLVSFTEDDL